MATKPAAKPQATKPARKRVDAIDREVGQNVKIHRVSRGLTQAELGSELGLTFQQIQKYEKGSNRITISTLMRLSQILDVPPSSLLPKTANNDNGTPSQIAVLLDSPEAIRLAREFQSLQGRLRYVLVELIEEMNRHMK